MKTMDKTLESLEKHKKTQEANVKATEAEIADIQNKIDIMKKYKDNHAVLDSKQKKEILSLICYSNIGYCCGLEKNCIWRNSVMKLLKISPKDYVKAKDICNDTLINKLMM